MKKQSYKSNNSHRDLSKLILSVLVLGLAFALPATAQDNQNSPGGQLNAVFYPAPPAGFNAVAASDEELAQYGFPPRPNPSEEVPFALWQRMVSPSLKRIANPQLEQTAIYNGPAKDWKVRPSNLSGTVNANSTNWSGYAVSVPNNTFKAPNAWIVAQWIVPIAQEAFGVCNGIAVDSSQWIGFDGLGSSDVLQAGTEADATCSNHSTTTTYAAWFEWFPYPEFRISNFAVAPGDAIAVNVWYTTSAPYGHAFILNWTQQTSVTIAFNPPPGTTYAGNSAEWIVERPSTNAGLTNLTNYLWNPWDYAMAVGGYNGAYHTFYPGLSPVGTIYNLTMVCPPWNPSTACTTSTPLSQADLGGLWTLDFYDSGPAQ